MATTRKPTSAATQQEIIVNLDTLERGKSYAPFTVNINGQVVTFLDPAELPWQEIRGMDNEAAFFDLCIKPEDKQHFLDSKVPGWKLEKLLQLFLAHYEIGDRGNANGSAT